METVALILYPLIEILRFLLDGLYAAVSSYGLSIVLLSLIVRLVMLPISRMAARAEEKHNQVLLAMEPALVEIRTASTGRERFERTEALFQEHRYHPIKSVVSLLPLLLQLPFLLAVLILLTSHPALEGVSFLFLSDLGKPDRLIPLGFLMQGTTGNLLPLLLTSLAITESLVKRAATRSSRIRFFTISVVIVVLIYPLPSAVCLYWLTSNVWSLLSEIAGSRMGERNQRLRSGVSDRNHMEDPKR